MYSVGGKIHLNSIEREILAGWILRHHGDLFPPLDAPGNAWALSPTR